MNTMDLTINGEIKTNRRNNFGFFSMKEIDISKSFEITFKNIKRNIQAKNLSGQMTVCQFSKHDANTSEHI